MRALEFQGRMNPDHTLTVPPEVAAQLEGAQSIRVILLVPDSEEDGDWMRLSAEQFLKGYADSDAIYDDLPAR